ncbi:MAG: YigZ family protein [Flavobacteriales bacterium]|nr:YigZ family protein [Flavobacteriales bacterium]
MSDDRYITLARRSEGVLREKASKFIGIAFPIAHEEEFKAILGTIGREHPSARHLCYAWVLGTVGERFRSSDAGEPAGTAGKPILRQLRTHSLTYAAVVVVRYFGGTLLGKAGLLHAYGEAARLALQDNDPIEEVLFDPFSVRCAHHQVEPLRSFLMSLEANVIEARYEETCVLNVAVPKRSRAHFLAHCERYALVVDDQGPK